ncbi:MAG: CaiB/BaiF CoA transferase family protein [Rhodospirillaceae bacterium]
MSTHTPHRGPLSGVTVIDLSRILAGPYCTFLMAEMGARVIKVEPPKGGDDARAYGPFVNGRATYFASVNRGKESIALDLKKDEDRAIFEKLLAKADVVVENFRPGTMEKLGFGWDTLHKKFPKLIYASASGFGHTGPNSRDPAYDMVVQGMGGIMSITGNEGQPPSRVGMSIGDMGAGLYTAVAVNAALLHREKTGESTKVDIAMFDCQLALLENAIMRYTVEGEIPGPLGARHPTITPFQAFKTKDGALIIAAGNDSLFVKTCDALSLAGLASSPDYKTNALRLKHHKELEHAIESVLKGNTTSHWLELLGKAGIPCGPINNVAQAISHPQVAARNMLVEVPDGSGGTLKLAGNPLKMSAFADPKTRRAAPDLDADRAAILHYVGG